VSPGFLYGRPELRRRIEAARARQMGRRQIARVRRARTDAGMQVLLAAKERRIQELEGELRELTRQLAICRGQLYDRVHPLSPD